MKAKLIKDHTDYHIVNEEQFVIGTTDKGMLNCTDKHKLSLSNCQAIERGFDLDELVDEEISEFDQEARIVYRRQLQESLANMFSKALELMGDKKFSEDDMEKAYSLGWSNCNKFNESEPITELHDFIQSLQQNEWEVEFEMEQKMVLVNGYENQPEDVIGFVANYSLKSVPKLDADGCLILKPLPKE
jgi:hypothetical protein